MGDRYVVAIKPSARRASAAAGEWVLEHGRHRTFDSRTAAREWARSLGPGDRTLWVQDAHPLDPGPADGYLLARRSAVRGHEIDQPGKQVPLGGR